LRRRDIYLLIFILVLFGFALWSIVPFNTKLLGENGRLNLGLDLQGGSYLVYQADLRELGPDEDPGQTMEGLKKAIERRIDIMGLSQPVVHAREQAGEYGIVIQLPGASEAQTEEVKGKMVALLTFMEKDETGNWTPAKGTVNGEELTLISGYIKEDTEVRMDNIIGPLVIFHWDETGQELSEQITSRLVGKPLAIYLGDEPLRGKDGHPIAPIVESVITDKGQIEGLSLEDAQELSDLLNAGRVRVPLGSWEVEGDSRVFKVNVPLYERSVDATLGTDSIQKSMLAAGIGVALLLLFMILYYRLPGFIACLSLGIYGTLLLAIFALLPITLTLPGIAAAILSLGMAVDANVLIFERMKEELRAGRTLGAAVEAGFNRAWTAIRDSNITTFIACAVLLWFGTKLGAFMVSGFAITLLIGVALSMFTAIVITRTFLRLIVGSSLVTNMAAYGVKA
jgi:preprotein translocase subunit SecD